MGPLNEEMKAEVVERQGDIHFAIEWTSLDEYLEHLVARGIAPNVASFVGATTVLVEPLTDSDLPHTMLLRRLEARIMTGVEPRGGVTTAKDR